MKRILFLLLLLPATFVAHSQTTDWANYGHYAKANAALEVNPTVVFMGNSITEMWFEAHPNFFTTNNFAARGIGGQVTSQMLCRFRADVLDLHPKTVVILAGTNDIAGNKGNITVQHVAENIFSMAELAEAAGIRPILCSALPATTIPWRPDLGDISQKIRDLNARLKLFAAERGFTWVDYYSTFVNKDGGIKAKLTTDGVHVTPGAYTLMEKIILPVVSQ